MQCTVKTQHQTILNSKVKVLISFLFPYGERHYIWYDQNIQQLSPLTVIVAGCGGFEGWRTACIELDTEAGVVTVSKLSDNKVELG